MKHTSHVHVVLEVWNLWNSTSTLTMLLIGMVLGVVQLGTTVGLFLYCVHTALTSLYSCIATSEIHNILKPVMLCHGVFLTAVCSPRHLIDITLFNFNLCFHALSKTRQSSSKHVTRNCLKLTYRHRNISLHVVIALDNFWCPFAVCKLTNKVNYFRVSTQCNGAAKLWSYYRWGMWFEYHVIVCHGVFLSSCRMLYVTLIESISLMYKMK
jgi:hypothetical protein